jgi:hypothetical protein
LFGGIGIGFAYGVARRFLPGPAWFGGVVVVVLVAGVFGAASDFTNPDSRDFVLLTPKPVIAAMLLALILLTGATLGGLYEWLHRTMPLFARNWASLRWYVPAFALIAFPPAAILALVVVGLSTVIPDGARRFAENRAVVRAAGTVLAAASAIAALTLVNDLATIAS